MPVARDRWSARLRGGLAALLLLASLCGLSQPVFAAAPAAGAAPVAAATPAPAEAAVAAGEPTIQQLEAMVSTLENPEARTRLVEQLRALVAAQKGLTIAKASEGESALPDTLGARALSFLAQRMDVVSRQLVQVANVFADLPGAIAWMQRQAEDSSARERWVQIAIQLALILAIGSVVGRGVQWLLKRPLHALASRPVSSTLIRIPLLLGRALLELAPIVAFIVVAYAILSVTEPGPRVRLVALAVVNATVIVQVLLIGVRLLFAPEAANLRLIRTSDEGAKRAYVWTRRLIAASVYGYFLAEGAYVLGLPLGAYGALLKLLGVLIAGMLITLILRNRTDVADWMRGNPLSGNGDPVATAEREAEGQGAVLRSARRRFAEIWHVLAILYVVVTFGVWVLNVYGGFEYLARATAVTVVAVAVARLLVSGLNRTLRRGLRMNRELTGTMPQLHERAYFYLPIVQRFGKTVIWLLALGVVLNGWGIDTLGWAESAIGRRIVGSVVSISLLLAGAVVAWEVVSAMIEHFLASTDRNGTKIERSARMRTLLPLLRNAFLILLVTMVSLITLSELGVNIAPLLAGAGVVGLAIGFGSQTLVKDIITGLFILFEDTVSVGDSVDVGGGHAGTVEAISIRSIRLRDGSGAVHSVPFSAVTTVKNMSKDFSVTAFNVVVANREDPDRVIAVLKEVGAQVQAEAPYAADILNPLEVLGVDKLSDTGIIILAQFKTRPTRQWGVAREFNRRMKKRFDELGITMPTQSMQLVVGQGAHDRALAEALSQGS
ncbi:mechanosensitive ion channel domain-containing protein [Azospirillum doebereinerae]|uniref:mechanosensitive ion channel domain-containing protein n=1 Tax=Azospirillum doebereinerae TaxID=92933 RepID=UPI001EE5604C|nr:mechanosensitive ion channel domain-containing protein [Azospirillum doebereinerae]MCG5241962.1 mechanosensitive ion channel [Azospirillum doebereinerae]